MHAIRLLPHLLNLALLTNFGDCLANTFNKNEKIAIIGTTGRLGRTVIQELANRNIATKCLLRHPIPPSTIPSIESDASSSAVAAYLDSLPNVEMIEGDVTNKDSLVKLIQDCTVVMALHGPSAPKPLYKGIFSFLYPESNQNHPKMVNYIGVQNIIDVASSNKSTVKRIVRITGKGESPFSIFSILINMLSGMAKGWNYEGEQLLRKKSNNKIDYTIIRPGILMEAKNMKEGKVFYGLRDNGLDMPVTPVSYDQIANLCIESLNYDNCARTTLTAMNTDEESGVAEKYATLLEKVKEDSKAFPKSLINKHKWGARLGSTFLILFLTLMGKGLFSLLLFGKSLFTSVSLKKKN